MEEYNIQNFLKTGTVDTLSNGLSYDEFREKVPNSLELSFQNEYAFGYYYKSFEIIFYEEKIAHIQILRGYLPNFYLELEGSQSTFFFNEIMTSSRLKSLLNILNIRWKVNKPWTNQNCLAITTQGGVDLLFRLESNTEELEKIST